VLIVTVQEHERLIELSAQHELLAALIVQIASGADPLGVLVQSLEQLGTEASTIRNRVVSELLGQCIDQDARGPLH